MEVRTASAEFFENLLAAMGPHELELYRTALQFLVRRVQQGLNSLTPSVLHGSILGYQVLFLSPEKVRCFGFGYLFSLAISEYSFAWFRSSCNRIILERVKRFFGSGRILIL